MNYNNDYPQGIWYLDKENENTAVKVVNNRIIRVPITTEILEEMKRQIEAEKMFMAFNKLNSDDKNIVGYLNLILSDYINFLSLENKNILINKMEKIKSTSTIDSQNTLYIQNLETNLKDNNIESFYNTLDEFDAYNALLNNETQGRSR